MALGHPPDIRAIKFRNTIVITPFGFKALKGGIECTPFVLPTGVKRGRPGLGLRVGGGEILKVFEVVVVAVRMVCARSLSILHHGRPNKDLHKETILSEK